jgi:uncharacterized protein YoaH (UPF0181 family)
MLDGKPLGIDQRAPVAQALLNGDSPSRIRKEIRDAISFYSKEDPNSEDLKEYRALAAAFADNPQRISADRGNLYHVELAFDPEDTLDWDRPLSEQSEKVRRALADPIFNEFAEGKISPAHRGSDVYAFLSRKFGDQEAQIYDLREDKQAASEYIASLGIRGIRYADQGSRADNFTLRRKANGKYELVSDSQMIQSPEFDTREQATEWYRTRKTYNYVVFNESDIRVVGRNGEMMSPSDAMGGEARAAQTSRSAAVTPEQDREYMDAVERGDTAEAQRMVDEAARAAGFTVGPVWHGSNTLFDEFSATSDIGFHFGSEQAAMERRTRLGSVDEIDIEDLSPSEMDTDSLRVSRGEIGGDARSDLYALLLRKLDYPKQDLRAQIDAMPPAEVEEATSEYRARPDSKRFADRVEKARSGRAYRVGGTGVERTVNTMREARTERALQRKRLSTPTKAFLRASRTLKMRDLGVWPSSEIASESGVPLNQFRDTRDYESVRETLIRNGYDAIQYENLVEDSGSTSYIVFSPSQIKSADAITYSDAGRVIPLSERFNAATGDIRFARRSAVTTIDVSDPRLYGEGQLTYTGKPSMTTGPIDVILTDDGRLLVEDGWHRIEDARAKGEKRIAARVVNENGTPLESIPRFARSEPPTPRRRSAPPPLPLSPDRAAATIPAAVAGSATAAASTEGWDTIASFQDFIDSVETSMRAYDQERVDAAIRVTQAVERDAAKKIVEQTRSIMRDKVRAERDAGKTKALDSANTALSKKFAGAKLPPPLPARSVPQAVNQAFTGGKAVMRGVALDTSIDSAVERSFWEALKRTRSSPHPGDKWRAQLAGMMSVLKAVDAETRGRTPEQVKEIVAKRIAGLFGEERRHMMSAAARANPTAMLAAIRKYATQHVADYYAGPLAKMIARYSPPRILAQFTDAPKAKLTALLGRLPAIPSGMNAAAMEKAILNKLATNLDARGNVTPESDLTALIDAHDAFAEAVAEDKRLREYLTQAWRGIRASMAEHAADDIIGSGVPPISGTDGMDPRSRGWWRSFFADDTYTYANVIFALSGGRKDSWLYKHFVAQPRLAVERATARKNAAIDALTHILRDEKINMLEMGGRQKPYAMPGGQTLHLTDFQRIGLWNGLGGLVDNSALATYDPDWAASYMNGAGLLSRYSATTGARIKPQDQMEAMDILTTIFKDMPESHKKLGRAMKDSMQSNTAAANDASRRLFGRSLFIIPNYWTIARQYTDTPGSVSSGTFLRTLLDSIGITKDRTDNTLDLTIDDAWQTFSRHAQQLSLFTEFAEQQHNLMAVLADANVRRAMSERFGTQIEKDINNTLIEVSGLARGAEEDQSTVDRAVTSVLGNVVTSMLWGSGSVYSKNRLLGGWTLALQLMKQRPALGLGLLARMTIPKSITFGTQTRAIRQALIEHGYFGDRWGLRAEEVFSQVYHRDAVLRPTATPMPLRKALRVKRSVDQWGIRPQARAEMRTAIMAIQAMVNDGMSMGEAVDATADAFREVQNPSTPFEHTREYRSILRNTWKKVVYPFTGQLFVTANIVRQDMIALAGAKARGEPTAALRARSAIGLAQMILNIAGSYGIGMVFASMLRGRIPFTGDDEDKERDAAWAVMQQASDLLDIIRPGLGRMIIGVAETTFSKRVTPREDSIIGRQGATLVQGIRQVAMEPARAEAAGRTVNEDRVLDGWRKLAESASALALPPFYGASRIARQAAGAYKIAAGEVEPTPPVDASQPRRYSRTENRTRAIPRRYTRQSQE